jgi:hypothetical protein
LAHYKEFLSIPAKATAAKRKYDVEFREARFGLIVGNYENIDARKMEEASRMLQRFEIVDYDTMLRLYLVSRSGGVTPC